MSPAASVRVRTPVRIGSALFPSPLLTPTDSMAPVGDGLDETLDALSAHGPSCLVIDDLARSDLELLSWSGTATHLRSIAAYLARVSDGEAEYLVARGLDGAPVAKTGIDYSERPGAGTILQLATHPQLQRLGLATTLISAAEERIRRRGLGLARMSVEDDNPRARALYERLGYRPVGRSTESWEAERDDGSLYLYTTTVTDLEKDLSDQRQPEYPDPMSVVAYDPQWPELFQMIGGRLRHELGDIALRIDHIGSTAVPGLDAKPIIDIQISVAALEPTEAYRAALERCGFVWREDNPELTKRYFRERPGERRTHIHVRRAGSFDEQFALLFRDYLISHPDDAGRYATMKRSLSPLLGTDRHAYTESKGPLIWEIIRTAEEWAQLSGWEPGPSDA